MKVVHKAKLYGSPGNYTAYLPVDFEFLHLGNQSDEPTIWYMCDERKTKEEVAEVKFAIFGTGQPLVGIEGMRYLGTVVCHGGQLVWHVWGPSEAKDN